MNCNETMSLFDLLIDDELDQDSLARINAHLLSCVDCQLDLEARKRQDGDLHVLMESEAQNVDPAIVQSIKNQVRLDLRERNKPAVGLGTELGSSLQHSIDSSASVELKQKESPAFEQRSEFGQSSTIHRIPQVAQLMMATAVGFLLAALIFQPWNRDPVSSVPISQNDKPSIRINDMPTVTPASFGAVSYAAKDLEKRDSKSEQWAGCNQFESVSCGQEFRTGTSGCEISTQESSWLRLADKSTVAIESEEKISLKEGRLFVCASNNKPPVQIEADGVTFSPFGACDLKTLTGGQTELIALDEPVKITGAGWTETVQPGYIARFSSNGLGLTSQVEDPLLATRWIHTLLSRGEVSEELDRRVEKLCESIGKSKLDHLYESEIRAIGRLAAPPLIAFLSSTDPKHQNQQQRRKAARILADVAGISEVELIVSLLNDPDQEVAMEIEKALERTTGRKLQPIRSKVRRSKHERWMEIFESESFEHDPWKSGLGKSPLKKKA